MERAPEAEPRYVSRNKQGSRKNSSDGKPQLRCAMWQNALRYRTPAVIAVRGCGCGVVCAPPGYVQGVKNNIISWLGWCVVAFDR